VTVDEIAWNGNRTLNSVREADSRVLGAREQLRNTEQNVLMDGVTAYMNVLRDTAILMLQRAHVHVESEEVREARDRFKGGEVTITDVEQAKAALARAEADALVADSTLRTSIAEYRKVIGEEPVILQPAKPIAEALPKSVADAIAISQAEHPAITAALHGVDTSELRIALEEGRLYPSIDLAGLFDRRFNAAGDIQPPIPQTLSLTGTVSVPLYDGGLAYAATRQAKEQLAQQELTVYAERERVRASVVSAWARNTAAPGLLRAAYSQVAAAELAVIGVREEAKDGERTTLDEIVAEQALLRARIQLVSAQRDAVVSSYAMLSAIGRLSTIRLALRVNPYNAAGHYAQVKDKWFGLRTPDGR